MSPSHHEAMPHQRERVRGKVIEVTVKGTFCFFEKCFGAVEDPV